MKRDEKFYIFQRIDKCVCVCVFFFFNFNYLFEAQTRGISAALESLRALVD